MEARIHPAAVVELGAKIGRGVIVHPGAIIGKDVVLEEGVEVGPHAVVTGRTSVGPRTRIHAMASVGSIPQDLKYKGEDAELMIGSDNMIREYSNISIGTEGGGNITKIADRNLFMVYTHIAHDCHIGSDNIFAMVSRLQVTPLLATAAFLAGFRRRISSRVLGIWQ